MTPEGVIFLGVGSSGASNGLELHVFPGTSQRDRRPHIFGRSASGFGLEYNYNVNKGYRFELNHVSSADALSINSYWGSGTTLGLKIATSYTGTAYVFDDVVSGDFYIGNKEIPMSVSTDIYISEYKGIIELMEF